MSDKTLSLWSNLKFDFPASVVVVLVALPLCLGIALASGAPLFSGIISGVVGGVLIGSLSKSPLSVSGPAAGLTVIVLSAIAELGSFETFLLAVCLAGGLQVVFGLLKAGVIGDFIPTSVIKGMLAAIGIILILKQIPHAIGYDSDAVGNFEFSQKDGHNTFSSLWHMLDNQILIGATIISLISLAFLFWWDKKQSKFTNFMRYVPGPLVVVAFGIAANLAFLKFAPELALSGAHLVSVPVSDNPAEFFQNFTFPDYSQIGNKAVWIAALTLALVASVETLLSIEAIDKLDPYKRTTPTNRELFAQGIGNMVSGALGGLPATSVIVRSSANVSSGARTKMSAILHGLMLLLLVISIPAYLNLIPLSALAAVLIAVGYKLAKPGIFIEKYQKGISYFVPFVITIGTILLTDLLVGIAVGIVVGLMFIVWENSRSTITTVEDDNNYLVRCKKDLFFMNKYSLKKTLADLPDDCSVLLDLSRATFIDLDNIEIINDFLESAQFRNIRVRIKNPPVNIAEKIKHEVSNA
ncbi:MAG: hypothetical protein DI586_11030 [Micavibrio aeruginosavorus]|uniref:STAS domain-containing protein n=1 Tax=Micavibrio aeruginosavorus TaxID=349221 RepID=A0A2W5FI97_9BACT|nr:MAG: hypothetical protein DI586_11030 [Micavibrio aeruginosavorus]